MATMQSFVVMTWSRTFLGAIIAETELDKKTVRCIYNVHQFVYPAAGSWNRTSAQL
jgi:hypothetical protein